MTPTRQLKAWRLQTRLKPMLLKLNRQIMAASNKETPALVARYDSIQRRIDITEKYLKL